MGRSIEEVEVQWRTAMEQEQADIVTQLVPEILRDHQSTALACELRYNRGQLTLLEGEGYGSERLAKAIAEFREGVKSGEAVGADAEPWRSLCRSQLGACTARMGNLKGAVEELQKASAYRPRSVAGLGALSLLAELVRQEDPRGAKRYDTQRLSYARALVRDNEGSAEAPYFKFLLAQELLDTPAYAREGKKLLEALASMTEDELGTELFQEVQELSTSQK